MFRGFFSVKHILKRYLKIYWLFDNSGTLFLLEWFNKYSKIFRLVTVYSRMLVTLWIYLEYVCCFVIRIIKRTNQHSSTPATTTRYDTTAMRAKIYYKTYSQAHHLNNCARHFLQDIGNDEFNIATSSLHALSNSMIMSRAEKPSPHSSPRMTRRSQTPNCCSIPSSTSLQSEIYISQRSSSPHSRSSTQQPPLSAPASSSSSSSSSASNQHQPLPTAPSMQSINGNATQTIGQSAHNSFASNNNYNSANSSNNSNSSSSSNYSSASNCRTTPRPNSSASSNGSGTSSALPSNRMSAPSSASSAACPPFNKVLNKALSADLNDLHTHNLTDEVAPPLPPRKSSPNVDGNNSSVNRMLKPHSSSSHSTSVTAASSMCNLTASSTVNGRSSENITLCDFDVPQSIAPPIPKHAFAASPPLLPVKANAAFSVEQQSDKSMRSAHHLINDCSSDDPDKVFVGPAETIIGIIDTRPLEMRTSKPTIISSNSLDKEPTMRSRQPSETNNVYHLKTNPNHIRHQSFPNSNSTSSVAASSALPCPASASSERPTGKPQTNSIHGRSTPTKSRTTPHLNHDPLTPDESAATANDSERLVHTHFPLFYENIPPMEGAKEPTLVAYENINVEYIAKLMSEGYSKESVVTALGISKNNIEMACDILHEFVTKNGG